MRWRQRFSASAGLAIELEAQGCLEVLQRAHQRRGALAAFAVFAALQSGQQILQGLILIFQRLQAFGGDGVLLASAFQIGRRGVTHVHQIAERGVDGAGAGRVFAADQLTNGANDVVAVAGLQGNQVQSQQLEATGFKHALAPACLVLSRAFVARAMAVLVSWAAASAAVAVMLRAAWVAQRMLMRVVVM